MLLGHGHSLLQGIDKELTGQEKRRRRSWWRQRRFVELGMGFVGVGDGLQAPARHHCKVIIYTGPMGHVGHALFNAWFSNGAVRIA